MDLRLYGIVGDWQDELDAKSVISKIIAAGDEEIDLYISSYGGSLTEGVAIYNTLLRHKGAVTAYIDGVAASAATVIMLGAEKVIMPENTMIMVHNPWTMAAGDHNDMAKAGEMLEKHRDAILSIYMEKTGKSEDELKAMMDEETWMTAEEALAHGFVDAISEEKEEKSMGRALACVDFDKFSKAPERLAKVAASYRAKQAAPRAQVKGDKMAEKKADTPRTPEVDLEQVKAEAKAEGMKAVKAHLAAVTALCEKVGIPDQAAKFASNTSTMEEVQSMVIDHMHKSSNTPTFSGAASVNVGADSRDKFKAAACDAIQMRGAALKHDTKNSYRHMSLLRLAEECVVQAGMEPARDRETLLKQAFNVQGYGGHTSSDFPLVLENSIDKSVLRGFDEAQETWDQICVPGSLSDFKIGSMSGLNIFDNLDVVSEGGEYKYGTIQERGQRIQLGTFGKLLKITREMIINDDTNQLTRAPLLMGRAAARVPGNLAYSVLTGNPNLLDGNPLFSAANNNTFNNTLGYAGLDALAVAIKTQKFTDSDGKDVTLGIMPRKLVVPPQLGTLARQLVTSELVGENNQTNTFLGMFDVVEEHRLGVDSATKWYLTADPAVFDTIMVAFLDGNQQPFVDEKEGWNTDSIEFKVRLDCAAAAQESKTMARGGDGT